MKMRLHYYILEGLEIYKHNTRALSDPLAIVGFSKIHPGRGIILGFKLRRFKELIKSYTAKKFLISCQFPETDYATQSCSAEKN